MEGSAIVLKPMIDQAFAKINQFPGGNTLFYTRFSKSRAVVSTWKSGKVVPSDKDLMEFLQVSNDVIKELRDIQAQSIVRQTELLEEFQSLILA
ncbi:hypothetical protein MUK70_12895 [Dyadobacter chenwenxiniae]|uniref:Uncharacterized protein n=1 Tax=Dyadobacter chenwenxiniae TaxID=2906456 RepID=A0A9X1PF27_9BACT|nr:hypothetical protein [Dyadobacter chenwenxiniae]MCF0060142.1 hypothetical protein [Dyadobacter chenwenxiniae]UON85879.1 hypothetical protein MUK70_12895 [Dyadobacter chenwenxiniae]